MNGASSFVFCFVCELGEMCYLSFSRLWFYQAVLQLSGPALSLALEPVQSYAFGDVSQLSYIDGQETQQLPLPRKLQQSQNPANGLS